MGGGEGYVKECFSFQGMGDLADFIPLFLQVLRARAADAPYLLPATCFSASYAWG